MKLLQKTNSFIRIFPQERRLVLWSCIHAFATGCYLTIILNIPLAIFLSKFGGSALAYVFIASAITSLLIGSIYSFLKAE